jgi:hypothetical protein
MRMMMKVQIPVEAGNKGITEMTLPKIVETALGKLRPEAVYFTASDGMRTAMIFFNMEDVSEIPAAAEPFFQNLNASVTFEPAMTQEDLQRGLQALSS